eukprot:Tbor_TRINITY_DN5889_c0_g1::TRINITY_DN5889_c0_g1_i3::g.7301::m.7301
MKGYKWEESKEDPKELVYGFKIAEPKKERARPVWACGVNNLFENDTFDTFQSSTRDEVYEMMNNKEWFLEFDVKSMYDHFVLGDAVKNFFQFTSKEGVRGRLKLLPMGFGPSAVIAQSATYKILNFKRSSVGASCIDNMGLANNSRDELIHDGIVVVNR